MYRAYEAMLNCLNALTSHTPWLKLFSYAGSNLEAACRPPAGPHVSIAAVLDTTTLNKQDLPARRTAPGLCHLCVTSYCYRGCTEQVHQVLRAARTQNASSRQEAQGLQERGRPLSTSPFPAAASHSREQQGQGGLAGAPWPKEDGVLLRQAPNSGLRPTPRRRLSSC